MSEARPVEIICSACGADTLLLRKPKYDGFTKVGETLTCTACGHEYATEDAVPFKGKKVVKVFTDADRSAEIKVFAEKEAERLCRHCTHYLVNPFKQWCAVHRKEVEATDTCSRFEVRPPPKEEKLPVKPEPKKPPI
jgi:hypothetical protein